MSSVVYVDNWAAVFYCGVQHISGLQSRFVAYMKHVEIQEMFHVYLNKFEFQFLRLLINKTHNCCFIVHNGHVPGIAK